MTRFVLDASVVLAHIRGEAGAEALAETAAAGACMSAVNFAEVVSKLMERGLTADQADDVMFHFGVDVVPFDAALAHRTGALRPLTKALGMSLGDRACLALAQREGLPAVTADRQWAKLKLGIEIKIVR
jgi:PIN domain nuclease of toxin-antitoxin system